MRGGRWQPIWESFYKDVIGQSTTLTRKDLPGLDFEEGGIFWDSIVNVKVVANLFFTYIAFFLFFLVLFLLSEP